MFTLRYTTTTVPHSILGQSLPGDESVLDSFSWKRKSAVMDAQASLDSIACFCATADSRETGMGRGRGEKERRGKGRMEGVREGREMERKRELGDIGVYE